MSYPKQIPSTAEGYGDKEMPKRWSSDDTGQWVQIYSHLINLCKLAIDDG